MAGFTTKTFKVHDDYMTPNSAWDAIKDFIPHTVKIKNNLLITNNHLEGVSFDCPDKKKRNYLYGTPDVFRPCVIWEAFYGDGKSGDYLKTLFDNDYTHFWNGDFWHGSYYKTKLEPKFIHKNIDFFKHDLGDVIVSNCPFSKKKEVFTRLKQLQKPFIIICPSSMINTKYIRELFMHEEDKLQIIIPRRRIHFIKLIDGKIPEDWNKKRCNFDCFYYCWKINFDRDIIWLED